ncbi:NADH pyrophosphatase [compost metagenome]
MKYCMECGTELEGRYLEKEGMIPFCPHCQEFRFPVFNTAVSMIVLNMAEDKVLLIQQNGIPDYYLVAGYINKGESAEHALIRELREEVGIEVSKFFFNKSEYFGKTNTLMLNFICQSTNEILNFDTDEVDYAEWFTISEALQKIKQGSLAQKFLEYFLLEKS